MFQPVSAASRAITVQARGKAGYIFSTPSHEAVTDSSKSPPKPFLLTTEQTQFSQFFLMHDVLQPTVHPGSLHRTLSSVPSPPTSEAQHLQSTCKIISFASLSQPLKGWKKLHLTSAATLGGFFAAVKLHFADWKVRTNIWKQKTSSAYERKVPAKYSRQNTAQTILSYSR